MIARVPIYNRVKAHDVLSFVSSKQKHEFKKLAVNLQGKKVVHVNATAKGGGPAEILQSFIPYLRAVGILAEWYAIVPEKAGKQFFVVTDKMRYALHGKPTRIPLAEWKLYEQVNEQIAADLDKIDCDILVIHDWQLLFSALYLKKHKPQIYVSHPDTSVAYQKVWGKMLPVMELFQIVVFSNKDFVHRGLSKRKTRVIAPVIDPFALKQKIVVSTKARQYLSRFGISATGPLILQVSRFDIMKNPLGVVEAFRRIEGTYPKARLALVGLEEATDNPAAEKLYKKVKTKVGKNPRISLFFDPKTIGGAQNIAEFTMMAQNAADVIVQNSQKEGFGLTLTEAMWKEKAVIGGPALGMKMQIAHGKNGYIAKNSKELAKYIDYFLSHPGEGKKLGKAAKESVRKNFLMPRLVLDHLKMYKKVS